MATILQQPDQYSFAGNIKNIIVTTEARIIFKLKHGSEVLFESSYDSDLNDKVEIDIKKIIKDVLTSDIPVVDEVTTRDFSSFSFIIDEGAEQFFYAFEGGVDTIIDSSWFADNFLTWQPQTSYVTWSQPQFLSYIALQVCNLKIKGYFSDGTDQTVTFGAFTANKINTANLQYSSLTTKFAGKQSQYVDVWTEDAQGARLSYIQRFVLKNSSADDNSFLFKNSLGGWDSVIFSGTLKNEASSDVKTFSQEDATNEYQVDLIEKYSKNTGYFLSEKHRIWVSEFFKTSERYFLSHRGYFEKLTVLSSTINSVKNNPSSYNFTFSLARTTKYLNLPRVESPESPIEIVDPTGELFFLAPRLSEFPSAEFVDEFLLPVQSPFVQEWKKITFGSVKSSILDYIRSQISPGIPQSLLDLSDIDPSLETANVGAYLVKLSSGKWGPGSVSIDLSNYFTKGDADERFAFKSHSHDYVPIATFNSHTGDSVKHTTQEEKDKIVAAYNDKHTHTNKANLDTINQALSKSSNVEFNDVLAAGSIAFYGGVGSGSTPAQSLLDLSDIDSTLSTAAVGSPLVKLANGKWGPGSVSIDLINYFTKEESDARFAFKSHSHDYVAPTAFNAHTGDTTKHITSAERVAWNSKEPALGNPDVDGKILASTAGGVRSWVNRYVLPIAAAAMLGGVMIGENVNVDAQGRISVAAPYSHPATHPASMIDESATRRFLTDAERANWNDSYDKRHTHGNKANLDSINQNLSQTSDVKFNDMIADGSVGFYGGVGSGSTPVASLLDLSDIDASISTAATGTPLVKLANGKWGAGSVSIDLSNYYNKSDADARYAFKSHSHDYVTTGVFNGHNHNSLYLGISPTPDNPSGGNFAIGTYNGRNFIQSHNESPLDINPLGNSVTINGHAPITSNSIGSQSVNYAVSAGNADTLDSYHASQFIMNGGATVNSIPKFINGSTLSSSAWSITGDILKHNNAGSPYDYQDRVQLSSENTWHLKLKSYHYGGGYYFLLTQTDPNYISGEADVLSFARGNVGIGTKWVYDYKLYVNGKGYFNGDLTTNGSHFIKGAGWLYFDSFGAENTHYVGVVNQYDLRLSNNRGNGCMLTLENTGVASFTSDVKISPFKRFGWEYGDGQMYNWITNSYTNTGGIEYKSGSWTANQSIVAHNFETWAGSDWSTAFKIYQDQTAYFSKSVYLTNGTLSLSRGSGEAYSTKISTEYTYPYIDTFIDSIAGSSYEGRIILRTSSNGGSLGDRVIIYNNGSIRATDLQINQGSRVDIQSVNNKPLYLNDQGNNIYANATYGNFFIGYSTDVGYKCAINGSTYFNGPSTINGALAIAGAFTGATTVVASSYVQAAYYKLGTWEIKENASGELEFIQSGVLKFKGTSAGLISQGEVGFYS